MEAAVRRDNYEARLAGLDHLGRPLIPLRSERTGDYAGKTGPPLAPDGARSRVVTNYRVRTELGGARPVVVAGWHDVVSDRGYSFLPAHIEGRGHNPIRDIAGITPDGWRHITSLFRRWAAGLFRGAR